MPDPATAAATVIGAAFGGPLTVWAVRQACEAMHSASWPTTDVRVTASELVEGPPSGKLVKIARFRAAVTYSYLAGGHDWVGHRVFVGDEGFESAHDARLRQRRYEPGARVVVHYNPADPSRAVLEPGATWTHWKMVGFGLVLLSVAIMSLLSWVRS